jgi:serine/threonine protein kinase
MIPEKIGRYEIKSELGRGGMATVFLAHDPRFQREVAIKVLPPQFMHDPQFKARFDREAQTIASLEITGIVPVYDYGEDNGQPYIVMRYLFGGSLTDKLNKGPLPLENVVQILSQLGNALDRAHAQGIIHRDLKPGNILFDNFGEAYIADFGIVKLTEASAQYTGSNLIGTPAYMSPEQARGERDIDGRSDIYALGVVVFEMLSGALPFDADTPIGMAMRHISDPIPEIRAIKPDLPPDVETVLSKALSKERETRFQNVNEFAAALSRTLTEPVESVEPDDHAPVWEAHRDKPELSEPKGDEKTEKVIEKPKPATHKERFSSGVRRTVWGISGIILAAVLIALLVVYFPSLSPDVTIRNELSLPVNIYINNHFDSEIPAHSKGKVKLESETGEIKFIAINSTNNLGEPIGDLYQGEFQDVVVGDTLVITNKFDGNYYFFPILTNETDLDCSIFINDGLPSEQFAGILKTGQTNVALGYYKWFKNSNITLSCGNELIWWGEREGTGKLLSDYFHDEFGVFQLTLNESSRP